MSHTVYLQAMVPMDAAGKRLDVAAAQLFPEYSRARLQEWIKGGELLVNGRIAKVNSKVVGSEELTLLAQNQPQGEWLAEPMHLDIVFEDDTLLVLNKPAGLVVHPAAGNYEGTLLNGLLAHCPALRHIPRAGIVHRLDKDTTGLMVVAKTLPAQTHLVAQLQARSVSREYVALVYGQPPSRGVIEAAIGRDPGNRKKMAVVDAGKPAITHYTSLTDYGPLTWMALKLQTGRTHQIRVHMTYIGHALVGDPVYGRTPAKLPGLTSQQVALIKSFPRQALHARALSLIHPESLHQCSWQAPLPEDIDDLLVALSEP